MILATAAVLTLLSVAKLILIVILTSILMAFVLAPLADALTEFPSSPLTECSDRGVSPARLIGHSHLSLVCACSGVHVANAGVQGPAPAHRGRDRTAGREVRGDHRNRPALRTPGQELRHGEQTNGLRNYLSDNTSSMSQTLLAITFIPFLMYFMLSWRDHVRAASVMLFSMENRNAAYVTLGLIAAMIRSFIVGNFMIGLFLSAASMAAFGLMGLPYFYFLGVMSGFLSLIPYSGVVLAILPPVIVGLGYLTTSTFLLTIGIVIGLHLFAMNVLYPMVLGKRLQLNPLAVTLSLLFWGWLWGAMGLLLAVPLTGALKIICDNINRLRPYGAWMGE